MTLTWKNAYNVGHADIDAQHQQLFSLANAFLMAHDKLSQTVCAMNLFKYTREHFSQEEQLMRDFDYPDMASHLIQHERLISRLNDAAVQIANETIDRETLVTFFSDWLLKHIATSDIKLAALINQSNGGEAIVAN